MSDALVEHCLELLAPLGSARSRRMFGGHGLYVGDLFVALIAFERLYLKVDAQTQPMFTAAGCEPFVYDGKGKPITMSYWTVPADAMDSPDAMAPWARLAVQAALRARTAVKSAPKPAAKKPVRRGAAKRAARPAAKAPRGAR